MGCCTGNNNAPPRSQAVPTYRSTTNNPIQSLEPIRQRIISSIAQPVCPLCKHIVRVVNIAGKTVVQCSQCGHNL